MKFRKLFLGLSMLLAFGFFATSCSGDGGCESNLTDEDLEGTFIGVHTLGLSNQVLDLLVALVNADLPADSQVVRNDLKFFDDTLTTDATTVNSALLEIALTIAKACDNDVNVEQFSAPSITLSGGIVVKNAKITGTATLDGDLLTTKLKISGTVGSGSLNVNIPPTNVTGTFNRTLLMEEEVK
jgi:hypothetical protein